MTWLKIDDGFHCHPKIVAVGNASAGLFVRVLSYVSQHLTDGFVPERVAKGYGTSRQIDALCNAKLIARVDGGYAVPDYLDFNPSAAEVLDKRHKRAEAGRVGGVKSGETRRHQNEANGEANASGLVEAKTKHAGLNPVPSRPVPSPKEPISSSSVLTVVPATDRDDDDDDFERVLTAIVNAKVTEYRPTKPRAYRAAVRQNTIAEDGELIRRMLADGTTPEATALFVLGHGTQAEKERTETAWCTPDCACEGDGWTRTPEGLAPCPQRT